MPAAPSDTASAAAVAPTLWGLAPHELHDRFWAASGVHVVRRGQPSVLPAGAELFLLIDPEVLVVFRLLDLVEWLTWLAPQLVLLRIVDRATSDYVEHVDADEDGRFLGISRRYRGLDSRLARVAVTPAREVAAAWQADQGPTGSWQVLRGLVGRKRCVARSQTGRVFDSHSPHQVSLLVERLMQVWPQPAMTIRGIERGAGGAWVHPEAEVARGAVLRGPAWVGAGRRLDVGDRVVGPAVLWDAPQAEANAAPVPWSDLMPGALRGGPVRGGSRRRLYLIGKRIADLAGALVGLGLTLPLYPFIALAIWIEDGGPIFFAHRRETRGGKSFGCLKFRSMRKDADQIKRQLASQNVADGPQFYVVNDPRTTRVGRLLRATQLDEVPQFWNVLVGHMSLVGPRPSPRSENQYCPAWRETRLSVRPGVTGLWQVERTRQQGLDFQEWIRLDMEYVENMSWRLDAWILWRTLVVVLRRAVGGRG